MDRAAATAAEQLLAGRLRKRNRWSDAPCTVTGTRIGSDAAVIRQGRWKSRITMVRHREDGTVWDDNAAAQLGLVGRPHTFARRAEAGGAP